MSLDGRKEFVKDCKQIQGHVVQVCISSQLVDVLCIMVNVRNPVAVELARCITPTCYLFMLDMQIP